VKRERDQDAEMRDAALVAPESLPPEAREAPPEAAMADPILQVDDPETWCIALRVFFFQLCAARHDVLWTKHRKFAGKKHRCIMFPHCDRQF
jgi:hypothetical protein